MRFKNITEVTTEDIVAIPLYDNKGRILINQNVQLTQYLISRLKSENTCGIYVYDALSEGITPHFNLQLSVQTEAASAANDLNIDKCMYLASSMVKKLENTDCIYTNMNILMKYDAGTYMHSSNVATYAGIVGLMLGYSYEKVKNLIAAALLHDVGKTQIPKEIIYKPDKLTKKEYEIVKTHAKLGYDMLKSFESIPSVVRVSVLQHHENYNGTGYPNHFIDNDIYEFAKIIHICDVYDAMISKRCYKKMFNPADVIEYMMANSGIMFNPGLLQTFLKSLVPYPEGITVKLSDGNIGIVSKINKKYLMRPIIRMLNGQEVDLTQKLNITIKKIITKI